MTSHPSQIRARTASHAMAIEPVPVKSLRPHPGNARTHSKKQIRQIAESIRQFGFTNPVLIDEHREIIAGHGRVEAAKLLGLDCVPTVRLSHLNAAQRRAYALADNKVALNAGWDQELLAIELQALTDMDFEVELTGFSCSEIELVIADARERSPNAAKAEDEARLPIIPQKSAVTRPGDVWCLGRHRLVCGDTPGPAAFDLLMADERPDLLLTNSYNLPIDGHVILIECDPTYCDTLVRRFEQVTGQRATHAESGVSFADVTKKRAVPTATEEPTR